MSPLGLYGALVALLLASAVIGWGLLAATGRREWSWFAPALGLAALVVIGFSALPGRAVTVSVLTVGAIAASLFIAARRQPDLRGTASAGLPVVVVVVLAASIPFAAGGGFDIMGTYVNNDLEFHLFNAEWLRGHEGAEPQQIADGYPVGPHGLVVALSTLTGAGIPEAWNALLIATAVATALASLSMIGGLRPAIRTSGGLLVGLSYLGASFYVQSAFKETLMAMFVLGFALALRAAAGERPSGGRPLPMAAVAPAVFALACVATYSVPGLGWPLGTLAVWAAVTFLPSRWPAVRSALVGRPWLIPAALLGLAAAALLGVVAWDRAADFIGGREVIGSEALANLFDPIPPYETLGLWLSSDYRIVDISFLGHGGAYTWLLVGLGLVAAGLGVLRLAKRRELALISALLAAAAFYAVAERSLGPYVGSKALAVASPLVMLTAIVGVAPRWRGLGSGASLARSALIVAFVGIALGSTYLALSGARLDRDDHLEQLSRFRDEVDGHRVLFLGSDELVFWALRGASVEPGTQFPDVIELPRTGERVDFDSFVPGTLDDFDYVVAPNSDYMSEPPSNFRVVARTESFTLYQRFGPTPPRKTLPEGELPGGLLDCDKPHGWRISRMDGRAHVFVEPPALAVFGIPFGADPTGGSSVLWLKEGQPVTRTLSLPAGRWQVSLQYHSLEPVSVDAPGVLQAELPPNSSRIGPYWPVGTIELDAPRDVAFTVRPETRSGLSGALTVERGRTGPESILGALVATPDPEREVVPLSQACGRLVDFYELDEPAQ
jgi:hypothetical protein